MPYTHTQRIRITCIIYGVCVRKHISIMLNGKCTHAHTHTHKARYGRARACIQYYEICKSAAPVSAAVAAADDDDECVHRSSMQTRLVQCNNTKALYT